MPRRRTYNLQVGDLPAPPPELDLSVDLKTWQPPDESHPLFVPPRDLAKLDEDDLLGYVRKVRRWDLLGTPGRFAAYCSGGEWKRYRHLAFLDEYLTKAAAGEIKKLMIFMPPRHGKSFLTSHYGPAWFLFAHPDKRVMLCAYEAEFAASWGRKARTVLEDHPELGVRIRTDSKAANRWDIQGTQGGMVTAGVGGPITGKGAHWLIIDDPVKNDEEAMSASSRDKKFNWFRSTALPRLEPGGVVTIIQTRWHEDDLSGRLLAEEGRVEDGGEWTVVNLPAVAEDDDPIGRVVGEALCPERYAVEDLDIIRKGVGSGWWAALYQQRPQPAEGGLFKKAGFRYWRHVPDAAGYYNLDGQLVAAKDCYRFMTVDLAASKRTRADWTVAAVWDVHRAERPNLILVHRDRMRLEGPDHLPHIRRMAQQYDPSFIGIEKATFGLTLIQEAIRRGMRVRALEPDRDKVSRALDASLLVENGQVWFPAGADWLEVWESELLGFPNAAHDDQVDVLAYAALELDRRSWWRAKRDEPKTFQDRVWAQVRGHRKGRQVHPELGRW